MSNTINFDATIEAAGTTAGEFVLRRGKIFEAGKFPELGGFEVTPEEAKAAVAAFKPCAVNLEHTSSLLDNKLGSLLSVEMGADGKSIFGVLAEPKWLADLVPEGKRKVSIELHKLKKTIEGIALTLSPRSRTSPSTRAPKRRNSSRPIKVSALFAPA
ncbi:MAG TPA: hypothetical protein VF600_08910 [Abditibacteriaceae bacterium]|jgi:hypothetical protein